MRPFKFTSFLFLLFMIVSLTACSVQKKLHNRVTGLWNIASYHENNLNTPDAGMSNIGTMSFFSNGTGTGSISFNISQNSNLKGGTFKWSNTDNTVTITDSNTGLAKSWIVIKSSKSKQEWQSTDGTGNVQSLTLTKVK
ncbi:MAG: hypothetical protein ACTHJ5_17915 [Ilyomonas sp.]